MACVSLDSIINRIEILKRELIWNDKYLNLLKIRMQLLE